MMKWLWALALVSATGAYAQVFVEQVDGPKSVRGFPVGGSCQEQRQAFARLEAEGFVSLAGRLSCEESSQDFAKDHLLGDLPDRMERIELTYGPNGSLARVVVSTTWKPAARLYPMPSLDDLQASIIRRYGQPISISRPGLVSTGDSSSVLEWATSRAISSSVDAFASKLLGDRWKGSAAGVVTRAEIQASSGAASIRIEASDSSQWSELAQFDSLRQRLGEAARSGRRTSFLLGY